MDKETARYIINYFSNLLSAQEKMAIKHASSQYKLQNSSEDKAQTEKAYLKMQWLTTDKTVLDLLKDGYDQFEINVANHILSQNPSKVFFNNCPKCSKLARTPYAKQCRFCCYNWHQTVVAEFRYKKSFQLTGRNFYLLGDVTTGKINAGDYIDLTRIGLNKRLRVESVEFARNINATESIALAIDGLEPEEKGPLIKLESSDIPLEIFKLNTPFNETTLSKK